MRTPDCGHVLIPEIIHHDCSLGDVRVDVYKEAGRPVFVQVEIDKPSNVHKLNVPDLDDAVATLQDARSAASEALLGKGIRLMTNEAFHCRACGAQAGIAGQYSDDPDERAAEFDTEDQFREDWERDHASCGADRDIAALRLGQMLMWLDENVADLTIMKSGHDKFTALVMDSQPSTAMAATSMSDLLAGTAAEIIVARQGHRS